MIDLNNLSSENTEYILNLPYYLASAGIADEFHELLTEFELIEYKNSAATPQLLIEDYALTVAPDIEIPQTKKDSLRLIQDAIRKSSHLLAYVENKTQLVGHVLGRLLSFKLPDIQAILEDVKK
jgi:hypothetical protein